MKLFRHIITVVCVVASFVANAGEQLTANAKCDANQPTNADLQSLQGTWEGGDFDDQATSKKPDSQETSKPKPGEIDLDVLKTGIIETPPRSHQRITVSIIGNSLYFHRDTNFWFQTTIKLPAGKAPKQLHATIKDSAGKDSIDQVVRAFFKIEDGTLTLATIGDDAEETTKGFDAATPRYELRKVLPQKKNVELPKSK